MKEMPKISEAEYEIMKAVWKNAPISTNEVVSLFENGSWSPKTVQTLLARLVKKGVLGVEMESEIFMRAVQKSSPDATFTHIRCISDSVDSKIPASFFTEAFDYRDGTLSLRRIALQILKRPSLIIALRKFAEEVKPAHKKYGEVIVKILMELK